MCGPLLFVFGGLLVVSGARAQPPQPPDLLFWDGFHKFSREDWAGAQAQLWGAVRSLRELQGVRLRCGTECGLRGPRLEESVLIRADCLMGCERLQLGEPSLYRLTRDTERLFKKGLPYNYLQVTHYKLDELDEAAAAAFTFYVKNPHHEQIQDDIQRYKRMKEILELNFRDLEQPQYQALYTQAVSLLSEGKFRVGARRLEESLKIYLLAMEDCRSLCEGSREQESETHRDFSEAVSQYYMDILQCRQNCAAELSMKLNVGHSSEDSLISLLSLMLNSYTKLEDWEAAAEIARSLLLFHPQNETVKERLQECEERLQGYKNPGKPREAIALYVRRTLSEKRLLYYAMEHLNISFHDLDSWTPEEIIPESVRDRVRKDREDKKQRAGILPFEEVTLTLTPEQMNGTTRVTLDGVLNEEECNILMALVQGAGGPGSGYRGRRSPHTPRERIQGLTVLRALQMAASGSVDFSPSRLYYRVSERALVMAKSYFGAEELHFSYTHLVCRSAVEGEQEGRSDLSHPVHADNCLLDPEERECWREPPAYVHRDFSGVLYLNDEFQGGDLFFTELDATTVTAEIRPRCGRLVLFGAGGDNAHGVRAVTQGTRCAIALWFTKSAEHAEQERSLAKDLLMGNESHTQNKESQKTGSGRETGRTERGTAASNEDPERPSGRRQKKRVSRKLEDEL